MSSEQPTNNNNQPIYDEEDEYMYSDEGMSLDERKAEAMKKYEEKWLKDQGVNPYAHILGETIHPRTVKSYRDLGREPEDQPYYASRRWFERMKRNMADMKHPPKIETTINAIRRLRDEKTGKEWLTFDYTESLEDNNGNEHHVEYKHAGVFELIQGRKIRDGNGKVTNVEVSGHKLGYDIPSSKKNIEDIIKKNTTKEKPSLSVSHCRTKGKLIGRSVTEGVVYAIKNLEDFKQGTFEELYQLGQRALSEEKPSLHRLKSPVLSDPAASLWHKNLPIQPVVAASGE